MALRLITGPWTGNHPGSCGSSSPAPPTASPTAGRTRAGLGPDISDTLDGDPTKMATGRKTLRSAEAACTAAINLERSGRTGEALAAWRDLFGPLSPCHEPARRQSVRFPRATPHRSPNGRTNPSTYNDCSPTDCCQSAQASPRSPAVAVPLPRPAF
jgi:hypothetical protein